MNKKIFYPILALILCVSAPVAVRAIYCNYADNTICQLYDICRQVLDKYPESEITEKGRDCTLIIENRRLIIRRKRTGDNTGYFIYRKEIRPGKQASCGGEPGLYPE